MGVNLLAVSTTTSIKKFNWNLEEKLCSIDTFYVQAYELLIMSIPSPVLKMHNTCHCTLIRTDILLQQRNVSANFFT